MTSPGRGTAQRLAAPPPALARGAADQTPDELSEAPAVGAAGAALEQDRIQAFLDARYTQRDVWHSFEAKSGQMIDCIDFFAQPRVKALAARGTPSKVAWSSEDVVGPVHALLCGG